MAELIDEVRQNLNKTMDELKAQREELRLKMALAKAEAKDEWDNAEKQWDIFVDKSKSVGSEVKNATKDVGETLKMLGDDLKKRYEQIKKIV